MYRRRLAYCVVKRLPCLTGVMRVTEKGLNLVTLHVLIAVHGSKVA